MSIHSGGPAPTAYEHSSQGSPARETKQRMESSSSSTEYLIELSRRFEEKSEVILDVARDVDDIVSGIEEVVKGDEQGPTIRGSEYAEKFESMDGRLEEAEEALEDVKDLPSDLFDDWDSLDDWLKEPYEELVAELEEVVVASEEMFHYHSSLIEVEGGQARVIAEDELEDVVLLEDFIEDFRQLIEDVEEDVSVFGTKLFSTKYSTLITVLVGVPIVAFVLLLFEGEPLTLTAIVEASFGLYILAGIGYLCCEFANVE